MDFWVGLMVGKNFDFPCAYNASVRLVDDLKSIDVKHIEEGILASCCVLVFLNDETKNVSKAFVFHKQCLIFTHWYRANGALESGR